MTIPDAAIEAAAEALCIPYEPCSQHRRAARAAIEAAMPAIREALAQEVRDDHLEWQQMMRFKPDTGHSRGFRDGVQYALRIVRGGTS